MAVLYVIAPVGVDLHVWRCAKRPKVFRLVQVPLLRADNRRNLGIVAKS